MIRILLPLLLLSFTLTAHAGQGPQNVAIVVNARSPFSVAVAHRYAELRRVPSSNMIYLDWDGSPVATDVETFRQRIFLPLAKVISDRKLGHITTIAYSADFPYMIDFSGDVKEDSPLDPTAKRFPQGSLTGLTYLGVIVNAKNVNYANPAANFYYRPSLEEKLLLPTRAFPPGAVWNQQGDTTETKGVRYLMSTMLAYTSGRGNSLAEVENYLSRAIVADGTYPQGKIYFLTNGDVRAKTREPAFKAAVSALEDLGVAAEVSEGILPQQKLDVMGAMIGAVDYQFHDSGSRVRPGAICENLTSFGGILRENGGQTALSECLRAGAAGSSGTVTEPFAIGAKFPHPMVHVHYAHGCSLAESFYQAVQGPYQLLIVGDPLCRPWATIPTIHCAGLPGAGERVSGKLSLSPSASTVSNKRVARYELYADGLLFARCEAGQSLEIDTAQWADGSHELRIIGYEDSPIATQGELITRITTANHDWPDGRIWIDPAGKAAWNQNVTIHAQAKGAGTMVLYHQQRVVASLNADRGSWTLPAHKLGPGPGEFVLLAARGPGAANSYICPPVKMTIDPPPALAASAATVADAKPGLKLLREGQPEVVVDRLADDWLAKAGVKEQEALRLVGQFTAADEALYQFQFEYAGDLELLVDGQSLWSQRFPKAGFAYVPVALAAGQHQVEIRAKLLEKPQLNAWFGQRGTQAVTGELFRHVE